LVVSRGVLEGGGPLGAQGGAVEIDGESVTPSGTEQRGGGQQQHPQVQRGGLEVGGSGLEEHDGVV
jgi:hypothetical protein